MGCNFSNSSNIKIISKITSAKTSFYDFENKNLIHIHNKNKNNHYYHSYNNRITFNLWKKVIDFLPFQDLKEVGKINRKFNIICKNENILVKFFKKINDSYYFEKKTFDSFSQLRKFE